MVEAQFLQPLLHHAQYALPTSHVKHPMRVAAVAGRLFVSIHRCHHVKQEQYAPVIRRYTDSLIVCFFLQKESDVMTLTNQVSQGQLSSSHIRLQGLSDIEVAA